MDTISRAVENGKDRGLTDQGIAAAVGEGMIRRERQQSAMPGCGRQPGYYLAAASLGALGANGQAPSTASTFGAAGQARAAEAPTADPEPRIYCDPEIGQ